jgi:sialidase-1
VSTMNLWLAFTFSIMLLSMDTNGTLALDGTAATTEKDGKTMTRRLDAEHAIVCRMPGEKFGYFGWPTVARLDDGTLLVASSGFRSEHVCPYGKTVLNVSRDNGRTWSPPRVIQDSIMDDRDAGIISLGGKKVLVAWFRSDTRLYVHDKWPPEAERKIWDEIFATWDDGRVKALMGSWIMLSDDAGETWSEPIRSPVSAPHGPIRLSNGELLYLGKPFKIMEDLYNKPVTAVRSKDGGRTWETVGTVPIHPETVPVNYCEPHLVELPSGRLIGMIRFENSGKDLTESGMPTFSMLQTESGDGGRTWTTVRPLGFHGSPPHLLRHSSGVLILTYGYREKPYGQRVALSYDDGATWEHDWIIRDDGPDGDLGYPSTVEMADGSLFSVYYQKVATEDKCSLLWSRWKLPKR